LTRKLILASILVVFTAWSCLIGTPVLGSISPLAYLLHREFVRSRDAQDVTAT
jgi:hypothetical protein